MNNYLNKIPIIGRIIPTKNYLSFLLLIFLFNSINFSQSDSSYLKNLSIGIIGGIALSVNDYGPHNPFLNTGVKIEYKLNSKFAINYNITYDFIKSLPLVPEFDIIAPEIQTRCIETSLNGKYFFKKGFPTFYLEGGLGYYLSRLIVQYSFGTQKENTNRFGVNAGFGYDFNIYKNLSADLALKYTYIDNYKSSLIAPYYCFYLGINYNL